ncbi:hypothetical protein [Litchfieldia salsa]|nr:hypothetical protein [Litchfieldia salsa]
MKKNNDRFFNYIIVSSWLWMNMNNSEMMDGNITPNMVANMVNRPEMQEAMIDMMKNSRYSRQCLIICKDPK